MHLTITNRESYCAEKWQSQRLIEDPRRFSSLENAAWKNKSEFVKLFTAHTYHSTEQEV